MTALQGLSTTMTRSRPVIVLLALLATACAARRVPGVREPSGLSDASGFLDDYSRLRPGGVGEVAFVYRNPDAPWTTYRKVRLEPVTLWRSGRDSLAPVHEEDLLRLVSEFEAALRRRLGDGFELVDEPSPGTLRVRLAVTEARASDAKLDVLTAVGDQSADRPDGPLSPELRRFIDAAAIEGELRDAQTSLLVAQGVDHRPKDAPPIATWGDLERALQFWVDRTCARIEAQTGRR